MNKSTLVKWAVAAVFAVPAVPLFAKTTHHRLVTAHHPHKILTATTRHPHVYRHTTHGHTALVRHTAISHHRLSTTHRSVHRTALTSSITHRTVHVTKMPPTIDGIHA